MLLTDIPTRQLYESGPDSFKSCVLGSTTCDVIWYSFDRISAVVFCFTYFGGDFRHSTIPASCDRFI